MIPPLYTFNFNDKLQQSDLSETPKLRHSNKALSLDIPTHHIVKTFQQDP